MARKLMKNYFLLTIVLLCCIVVAPSCDKHEPTSITYESYLTDTYSSSPTALARKLSLNYNGQELIDKKINFYSKNNKKARMELLNIIEREAKTNVEDIELYEDESDPDFLHFKGTFNSKRGKKISYTGKINRSHLILVLQDV